MESLTAGGEEAAMSKDLLVPFADQECHITELRVVDESPEGSSKGSRVPLQES